MLPEVLLLLRRDLMTRFESDGKKFEKTAERSVIRENAGQRDIKERTGQNLKHPQREA